LAKINIIAVLGVSGVGKTSAIKRLGEQHPLLHLQASDLLKAAYIRQGVPQTSEQLRLGAVASNQRILIDEFQTAVRDTLLPVVFDGHSVIEGAHGLEFVDWNIFKAIGAQRLVFLESTPQKIHSQRMRDTARKRAPQSVENLELVQEAARRHSELIARKLGVPFLVVAQHDAAAFRSAIFPL
jgi:adenylate kinase